MSDYAQNPATIQRRDWPQDVTRRPAGQLKDGLAVLLCGGRSQRMAGVTTDKVLEPLAGSPVFSYSARAFIESGCVDTLVFVVRDDVQQGAIATYLRRELGELVARFELHFVPGGVERQESVLHGLRAVPPLARPVFIHDAARPLITPEQLHALDDAARQDGAATLAHRVTDSIKSGPLSGEPLRGCTLDDVTRSRLWAMETPQVFRHEAILAAYESVHQRGLTITDDVAAARLHNIPVTLVENRAPNPKLTYPIDFAVTEFLLHQRERGCTDR